MLQILEYFIMIKILGRFGVILLLFISSSSFSQQNDFLSWNSIKITKKVYKRTNLAFKQGLRLRENASLVSNTFSDIKLTHKIRKKDIRLSAGYGLGFDFDPAMIKHNHRAFLDFNYRYKLDRMLFRYRKRLQYDLNNQSGDFLYRHKVSASYNVRKTPFEPYIGFECFINDNIIIDKLRYTTGFSHPIYKDVDFGIYYRLQRPITSKEPSNLFILGALLEYKM